MRKTVFTMTVFAFFALGAVHASEKFAEHSEVNISMLNEFKEINSFCKAIVKGDLEMVKSLISLGEDVNQKSLGKTPAIFAARYNRVEILKVLISNGADLSIKCDRGYSIKKHAKLSKAHDALKIIEETAQS